MFEFVFVTKKLSLGIFLNSLRSNTDLIQWTLDNINQIADVVQLKLLSVTNNSVDSRTAAASHMGDTSSAHDSRSGRLRTNAVICS